MKRVVVSPSSAVGAWHANYVEQLRPRSGRFLHYIVDDRWPVGQHYVHPLEQHPQGLWGGRDYSQPDGGIFRKQQDIQGSHLPHLLKERSRRGAVPSRLHPLLQRSPHGQGQKTATVFHVKVSGVAFLEHTRNSERIKVGPF